MATALSSEADQAALPPGGSPPIEMTETTAAMGH
jgi:hypothetical protein